MPSLVSFLQSVAKAGLVYSQLGQLLPGTAVHAGSLKEGCSSYASDACLRYGTCCSHPPSLDTCCHNAPNSITFDSSSYNGIFWATRGRRVADCNGTYKSYCDPTREYTNITSILTAGGASYLLGPMRKYWTNPEGDNEDLWAHEWAKYGTCMSTLEPKCYSEYSPQEEVIDYFESSTKLLDPGGFPSAPSGYYALQDLAFAGIVPSETQTYTADEIIKAFGVGYPPLLQCKQDELTEIWWYSFDVRYLIPPVGDSNSPCPATGIKYLAKPFSGTGTIEVRGNYDLEGCLTGKGTVVYGGPCATFLATPTGGKFTLSTSIGKCAIQNEFFTCSPAITTAGVFTNVDLLVARTSDPQDDIGWWIWYVYEEPNATTPISSLAFSLSAVSSANFGNNVFLSFVFTE